MHVLLSIIHPLLHPTRFECGNLLRVTSAPKPGQLPLTRLVYFVSILLPFCISLFLLFSI
uniref:Uncharacterized protein n=1 Tax=Daphnia magna TaxID=35525 RepID=A0A0P6JXI1_9CRUS